MAIPNPLVVLPVDALGPALDLGPHEHVAVVGGGGKTTLAHALVRYLSANPSGRRCVLTTTTKMGCDQDSGLPVLIAPDDVTIAAIDRPTVVWGAIDEPVALGVDPNTCDRWFGHLDHLVVEADGARRRPFKAPADHEPVVGSTATLAVSVIGVDALGVVIDDGCHRPHLVAELGGCRTHDVLTPQRAARVLLAPKGNRRAVPPEARFVVVVTKVSPDREDIAQELAAAVAAMGAEGDAQDVVPLFAVALS
ncbi:MAG: putative selenium-dependent hydroxylase accessory protein YqeC [Actinomycetia bacterium]|nr:putative selenium-dependent hydroxylase accessory protein YqeC [Actinomycetes bacterium]MCP4223330.1 putative selenium-dependent hydroxylase accessory protein YqeC [Actinomycetes bacterium]MCP5034864.1 putative selenium-dependent hydroxylase accessory protein YqeC [Actinomycetes bacterium]